MVYLSLAGCSHSSCAFCSHPATFFRFAWIIRPASCIATQLRLPLLPTWTWRLFNSRPGHVYTQRSKSIYMITCHSVRPLLEIRGRGATSPLTSHVTMGGSRGHTTRSDAKQQVHEQGTAAVQAVGRGDRGWAATVQNSACEQPRQVQASGKQQ